MDQVPVQESLQVVCQFAGRAVAIGRTLVQTLHTDHVQVARHPVIHRARRHRVLFEHADQRFHGGAERRMTGDHVIENRAQCVDVDRRAGLPDVPGSLFGSHVAGRAEDLPGQCQLFRTVRAFGQSKVGDLRWAGAGQQDISRLQIAVDHAVVVGARDGVRQIQDQLGRLLHAELPPLQFGRQSRSFDEGHDVVVMPGVGSDVVDRHDARVIQARGHFRFGVEPLDGFGGRQVAVQDHLQGDGPLQFRVVRLEHDPHAAAGDFLEQLVAAARCFGGQLGDLRLSGRRCDRAGPCAVRSVPARTPTRSDRSPIGSARPGQETETSNPRCRSSSGPACGTPDRRAAVPRTSGIAEVP